MTTAIDQAPPLGRIARVADLAGHRARMDRPLVSYRRVSPAGHSPAPTPAFLFGSCDAEMTRQVYGQIETPETGVTSIADAAVAPTGIGLCREVAFSAASLNHPLEHVATIVARLNASDLPCRAVPGPLVPLFGPAEEDEGILILDYLPRLWLLEQAGYPIDTVHFLVPDPLGPMLEEVVRLLGIADGRLVRYAHWQEAIRTELLLLPSILRGHDRLSPDFGAATRFWTERMGLAAPGPDVGERIYVPSPGPATALRNHDRIEAVAQDRGYRIAPVEPLGFADRAALFGRASHIAGPYSTAFHYSVFAREGAAVCALRGARGAGTLQTGLCHALGQTVGYVVGAAHPGGFAIDEADFGRALDLLDLPA